MNNTEQTKSDAICHIQEAQSFMCLTVRDGSLDVAMMANPNTIGMMLLAVMRNRPDFANAVNFAALAYARENIIPAEMEANKENQQ